MPRPLPDRKRAAILADIEAGQKSRNQIARDHGVSVSTVTKLAPPGSFDRSLTKRATEAKVADMKAWRAETSRRFLEEANKALDRLGAPYTVHAFAGKDGLYREHQLDLPPAGELRNLMTAAAVAFDKHLAADRHDAGGNVGEVASLLGTLFDGLQARHGTAPE